MQPKFKSSQAGFIRMIVIVIAVILILVYFGDDVRRFLESDGAKQVAKKVFVFLRDIWNNFVKVPLSLIWDKIVVDIIWNMILQPLLNQIRG